MADLILHCDCGLRVNAPGASPGRVGRCPRCGERLRVPDEPLRAAPAPATAANARARRPRERPLPPQPVQAPEPIPDEVLPERPRKVLRKREVIQKLTSTGGLLPVLDRPESSVLGSVVYPLRGAESMGVIGVLGIAIWMLGTAVPEYLASLMDTAASTGHSLLGLLVSLITSLPFLLLAPFAAFYWLSYLGRVLVSGAKGETAPPRTPDRDFDGFSAALLPWMIWAFWGLGVGFAPAIAIAAFSRPMTPAALWTAAGLGVIGFGYATMALILAHVHGHFTAVEPSAVVGKGLRTAIPLAGRCLVIAGLLAASIAAFVATIFLRDSFFWIYLPLRFLGCASIAWATVAAMRILGIFAYRYRDVVN